MYVSTGFFWGGERVLESAVANTHNYYTFLQWYSFIKKKVTKKMLENIPITFTYKHMTTGNNDIMAVFNGLLKVNGPKL